MGIPENELAKSHTADEVGDVMGELMNQIVGDFTGVIGHELHTSITQNQPKMLTINKQVQLSIDTNLDRPQARRVTFMTEKNNIFYLELAMDKTEFIKLPTFEEREAFDADMILEQEGNNKREQSESSPRETMVDQDLLDELGF
jgi:hypothetical protein